MSASPVSKRPPQARAGGRRSRLASPAAASALAVLVLLLAAAFIPLSLLAGQAASSDASQIAEFLGMAAIGWLIARHQPRNPIGWLLLIAPVGALLSNDTGPYIWLVYRQGRHLPLGPVALLLSFSFLFLFVTFPLVILLFPDGKLPSPRWRWVLWGYLAAAGCLAVSYYTALVTVMVTHSVRIDDTGGLVAVDSPSGRTAWLSTVSLAVFAILAAFWLSFVGRLVLNFRRSTGERRQQLKWLLSGSALAIVGGITNILLAVLDPNAPAWAQAIVSTLGTAGLVALPLSIGVAILKYRLYEIDRIISRTLAYAIVTGLLIGLYAGLVLLATRVLSFHTPVAVAASTLAAAALFNPLRRRVQLIVDRRFNRARYDADQMVAAFAARLKDAVDLGSVRDDLAAVVQKALEPAHISVWIRAGER